MSAICFSICLPPLAAGMRAKAVLQLDIYAPEATSGIQPCDDSVTGATAQQPMRGWAADRAN